MIDACKGTEDHGREQVTVPLCTQQEVIKQMETQKTIMQDRLVVSKERVEVPHPVTVIKEVWPSFGGGTVCGSVWVWEAASYFIGRTSWKSIALDKSRFCRLRLRPDLRFGTCDLSFPSRSRSLMNV